jgi:hypothetical protein
MFVIFDGYVKNENVILDNYTTENSSASEVIFDKSYSDIVNKIISGINTSNYVSLIGTTIDVQLAWLDISHYGIMQLGAGAFNYNWLMNKNCMFIGKNKEINDEVLEYTFQDFYFRENKNFTTYIHPKLINFDSHNQNNSVYYIDWRVIFYHIVRDLLILKKYNYSLSQLQNINAYNIYMYFDVGKLDINVLINMNFYDACNVIKKIINTKM